MPRQLLRFDLSDIQQTLSSEIGMIRVKDFDVLPRTRGTDAVGCIGTRLKVDDNEQGIARLLPFSHKGNHALTVIVRTQPLESVNVMIHFPQRFLINV